MCLCELASIFVHKDPKSSIHWFKLALMLYCSRGNSDKEARTLFTIATLSCGLREYTVATAYFKQVRKHACPASTCDYPYRVRWTEISSRTAAPGKQ